MKGKITEHGELIIQRGDHNVWQSCPYRQPRPTDRPEDRRMTYCSDKCPLFGEPHVSGERAILELCHAVLHFDSFEDERPQPEEEHLSYDQKE